MSPFAGYLLGLVILVLGLAVAAYLLNVPTAAVVVGVVLVFIGLLAWATRRPRVRPSTFTGRTPNAPSLDRTVLMELKTTLMERPDSARTQATTQMPQSRDARTQATTRLDKQTSVTKRPDGESSND
jgi:hypothetical protein